jgi:hypothetical protein
MGFQFDVIFIDSFTDDVTYVREVEICVERMICYIPRCICYGSENLDWGLCMMSMLDLLALLFRSSISV